MQCLDLVSVSAARTAAIGLSLLFSGSSIVAAQAAAPRMVLREQMRIESKTLLPKHMWSVGSVLPGRNGRIILMPQNNSGGLLEFDSLGAATGWHVELGNQRNGGIGWPERMGRLDDAIWISDFWRKTNQVLDLKGEIARTYPFPSWIRPSWSDRHQYPIFATMHVLALFANGDMLVTPYERRTLFDVANYDRDVVHVMRVDVDGIVQRDVFHAPQRSERLELRTENGREHVMAVPFAARAFWGVSLDGNRITLVQPGVTVRDSGTFRVTSVTDRGDTVYARSFPMPAVRVDAQRADSVLKGVSAFGDQTAEKIRGDLSARIPAFRSYVGNAFFGADHSTWVMMQSPSDSTSVEALVIDDKGSLVGRAPMPSLLAFKPIAADRGHIWGIDRTKPGLVRLGLVDEVGTTPAQRARNAKAATAHNQPIR